MMDKGQETIEGLPRIMVTNTSGTKKALLSIKTENYHHKYFISHYCAENKLCLVVMPTR